MNGIRYIDDYEFACSSVAEAEDVLSHLQANLREYELDLNPQKTRIVDLPQPMESSAVSEVRSFQLFGSGKLPMLRYFDRVFELHRHFPEEGILRFALSRVSEFMHSGDTIEVLQNLLLQAINVDGGLLPHAINAFENFPVDRSSVITGFNDVIRRHAPLGHSHEVAWAIWGILIWDGSLDTDTATLAVGMNDSVVGLLFLAAFAEQKSGGVQPDELGSMATAAELDGENWLFAYESQHDSSLRKTGSASYIGGHAAFNYLRGKKIRFFDPSFIQLHRSKNKSPSRSSRTDGWGGY